MSETGSSHKTISFFFDDVFDYKTEKKVRYVGDGDTQTIQWENCGLYMSRIF